MKLVLKSLSQFRCHGNVNNADGNNEPEKDKGQLDAVEQHYDDEDEGEEQVDQDRHGLIGDEFPDCIQLAHPVHDIPDLARFKIHEGKGEQVFKELCAQLGVDLVGCVDKNVVPRHIQYELKNSDCDKCNGKDIEGGHGSMDDDLVEDHLRKERCDQTEKLDDKGACQDFGHNIFVVEDFIIKPAEAKGYLIGDELVFEDDHIPARSLPKITEIQLLRCLLLR
ncbi:MAG: hypothetical protein A4E63_02931 [Syntrophorhabdus sp. PtaU1.Bin050]|nr:MAG: hypothetical protein A4E63_02931 [Syntrophorhabdus sp. PtaU1.Bin050]